VHIRGVVLGLAMAVAGGAAILVVGATSWSRWSWWMVVAHPVFLLQFVDAIVLAVFGGVVMALGRRASRPVGGHGSEAEVDADGVLTGRAG
jgi:hypothetical protein